MRFSNGQFCEKINQSYLGRLTDKTNVTSFKFPEIFEFELLDEGKYEKGLSYNQVSWWA
jgi:hypothetical protein